MVIRYVIIWCIYILLNHITYSLWYTINWTITPHNWTLMSRREDGCVMSSPDVNSRGIIEVANHKSWLFRRNHPNWSTRGSWSGDMNDYSSRSLIQSMQGYTPLRKPTMATSSNTWQADGVPWVPWISGIPKLLYKPFPNKNAWDHNPRYLSESP